MKMSNQFIAATRELCTFERHVAAPLLRKTFRCEQAPVQANLTICGLGFYELYVNGKNITKGLLAPYISNPDDLVYYDTYDVKELLTEGDNAIGIILGNGMQNAFGGMVWDFEKAAFRGVPRVALCLEMTDGGGETTELEADESFRVHPSPILFDELRIGEIYDASKEIEGWALPGFDDSGWEHAYKTERPRGQAVSPLVEPITAHREIKPVRIFPQDGGYCYDFGVNTAGLCRLDIQGRPGQKIVLQYGEYLEDGKLTLKNIQFGRAPDYRQEDVYYCKGGSESYLPRFTYHGFQYVLVQGVTQEQATADLLTYLEMYTDLQEAGGFSCSDDTANALQAMTRRSTLSNFYYFPTDCPQREKNGWTADAALSSEHTLLNLRAENAYRDWMRNICKAMADNGALPGIVPTGGWGFQWGNGPAWDCVLVYLPYFTYVYRQDRAIVEESAPAILRYLSYLTTRMDEKGLIAIGLGDWCPAGRGTDHYISPLVVTDSILSMDIADKAAYLFEQLGMEEQRAFAKGLALRLRKNIRRELMDLEACTVAGHCQTSQAMGLYYGLFDDCEKEKAFYRLMDIIHEDNGHINVGVLGGRVLFHVLSAFGESDLAYRMITQKSFPSYGYWVEQGATTLWEEFQLPGAQVNSRNHHFWGDISGWFIQNLAGIRYNPTRADGRQADIRPAFVEALTQAEGFHICPYGEIRVKWARTDKGVALTLSMPQGMTGQVILPKGYTFADGSVMAEAKSGQIDILKH